MPRKRNTTGLEALHDRYIGTDSVQSAELEAERLNAEVAQRIYEARKAAGLTQAQLAALVGTTQSVISRLEQAEYDGHSLTMLDRIARALKQRLDVQFVPAAGPNTSCRAEDESTIRYVFRELARSLRQQCNFSVEDLAGKLGVSRDDILCLERDARYRPSPLMIYRMSQLYGIPQTRLAVLAGAVSNIAPDVRLEASRFAAKSESFARLSSEEKQTLDEFVRFLRSGT